MDQNENTDLSELIRILNNQFIIILRLNAEILAKLTDSKPEKVYTQFSDLYKVLLSSGGTE